MLGVESLDLSTCRLILCFHLREQPSHWGSATAWDPQLVRHVSSICFSLWLTSIKPNRRAWYYGSRNSQDVAIASSHRLATSPSDSVLRTASKSRRRQKGARPLLDNQHAMIDNTRIEPAHPMPRGGDSVAFQTYPLNFNFVSTSTCLSQGPVLSEISLHRNL